MNYGQRLQLNRSLEYDSAVDLENGGIVTKGLITTNHYDVNMLIIIIFQ